MIYFINYWKNINKMPSVFIEKTYPSRLDDTHYKVRVRTLKNDPISCQKSRTFSSKLKVKAFKIKLEKQLSKGDYSFFDGLKKRVTIGDVIFDYLSNSATKKHIKYRTISPLRRIAKESPMKCVSADKLGGHHWYILAQFMIEHWSIKPQTIANYLSILKSALNK